VTSRQVQEVLIANDEIASAPLPRSCDDHSFELPGGIFAAMAVMFTGFIVVLSLAFTDRMAVSYAVIFAFIAAFFLVPSLWPRIKPQDQRTAALSWNEFVDRGIETATGRTSAASATILVLSLPFLILCFAIAIATIAALV
jgi:hypothetical protein